MSNHPEGALAEALVSCGIDPLAVVVEWDGLCQEDVLTFNDQSYPAETLEALVELSLTFPSRFVFSSRALQETYEKALMASPRVVQAEARLEQYKSQLIEGAGLRDFPPLQPRKRDACRLCDTRGPGLRLWGRLGAGRVWKRIRC